MPLKYTKEQTITKFWTRVKIKGLLDCWVWQGHCLSFGYGQARFDGKRQVAHRIAWQITYGPIPQGLFVLHKCDNPPCVNPTHLYVGTHTDNMRDVRLRNQRRKKWAYLP